MRIAYPLPYPYPIPCPYPWPYQRPEQRQGSASGFSARKQRPAQRQNPTRARGKPRPIGVPGLTLCRNDHPASRPSQHNVIPGSHGERDAVCSPGSETGRRRTIGVVAALTINPRATTPMVRRWAAGTPKRHSGPEGRGRGNHESRPKPKPIAKPIAITHRTRARALERIGTHRNNHSSDAGADTEFG